MTEDTLYQLLDRVNEDPQLHLRMQQDVTGAFAELDLSPAEQARLLARDEDALRRLSDADTEAHLADWVGPQGPDMGWFSRLLCTRWFCGPGKTRNFECPTQP